MVEFGDVVEEGATASWGDYVILGVISAWSDRIGDGAVVGTITAWGSGIRDGVALGATVNAFGGGVVVGAIVACGDSVLNWGDCVAVTVATAAWVDYVAVIATNCLGRSHKSSIKRWYYLGSWYGRLKIGRSQLHVVAITTWDGIFQFVVCPLCCNCICVIKFII